MSFLHPFVGMERVELSRPYGHQILSLGCLPVPAHPDGQGFTSLAYESPVSDDRKDNCLLNFFITLTSISNDSIDLTLDDFISF